MVIDKFSFIVDFALIKFFLAITVRYHTMCSEFPIIIINFDALMSVV